MSYQKKEVFLPLKDVEEPDVRLAWIAHMKKNPDGKEYKAPQRQRGESIVVSQRLSSVPLVQPDDRHHPRWDRASQAKHLEKVSSPFTGWSKKPELSPLRECTVIGMASEG